MPPDNDPQDNPTSFISRLEDFLINLPILNNPNDWDQPTFRLFMDLTRDLAWDIPSALGSICDCQTINRDFYMHRSTYLWPNNNWEPIDLHFKDIHGLDLTDIMINWDFDT